MQAQGARNAADGSPSQRSQQRMQRPQPGGTQSGTGAQAWGPAWRRGGAGSVQPQRQGAGSMLTGSC